MTTSRPFARRKNSASRARVSPCHRVPRQRRNMRFGTCLSAAREQWIKKWRRISRTPINTDKACRARSTSFFVFFYREIGRQFFLTTVDNIFLAFGFKKKYDGFDDRVL